MFLQPRDYETPIYEYDDKKMTRSCQSLRKNNRIHI